MNRRSANCAIGEMTPTPRDRFERPTRRVEAGCSCSAELARPGLDGPIRTDAGFRRLGCNQMPSAAWLRRDVWHRTTASNREPSALEAAALPVELARCGGCGWIRTNVSSRETALQAARNRPRCHAPFDWRLVHDLNVRPPASQTGALDPAELTRHLPGAERGLRSPDARAFNAPLYRLSYLGEPGASCGIRTRGFRLDRPALWPLS